MADVTITPSTLTMDTRSGDLEGSGSAVNAAQTFAISGANLTRNLVIFMEELNAGAATVTFDAGDYPPSTLAGLGSLAISLAQDDTRMIVLQSARFTQSDGTITGTVTTNNCRIQALRIPNTV